MWLAVNNNTSVTSGEYHRCSKHIAHASDHCLCAHLFICALWSPAGKGMTSWLSFVVSNCEFVTFPLVSWVRCGT